MLKFEDFNLSPELANAIKDMGFESTFPIQAQAIPPLLAGKDVIGLAQTGTGKTAAFLIPAIEKIKPELRVPQVLVLCPTRELAIQVSEDAKKLLRYKRSIECLPVFGGDSMERQTRMLRKGVQLVVGTPGRLMDHMRRKTLSLSQVSMVILDEADEMLNMGFRDDIETILQDVHNERQTVLFSATMSPEILHLTKRYQKDPQMIKIQREERQIPLVDQVYFDVEPRNKVTVLSRLFDLHNPKLAIVFCNTKRAVDDLMNHLQAHEYRADAIHGDCSQGKRNKVMARFRNGEISILVATDVAARGIDISEVEMVVNFELPKDEESYVHRIGRTGRAGRTGNAFSLVSNKEFFNLVSIMRYTKMPIEKGEIPSAQLFEQKKTDEFLESIKKTIAENNLEKYTALVKQLGDANITPAQAAAALMHMKLSDITKKREMTPIVIESRIARGPRSGGGGRSRSSRPYERSGERSGGRERSGGFGERSGGGERSGDRSRSFGDGGGFRKRKSNANGNNHRIRTYEN